MNRRKRPKASVMFLLELMISIFFFTIAAAICVQIFVKAHLLTKNSVELQQAVNVCSATAELAASADSYEDAIEKLQTAMPQVRTDSQDSGTFYIDYEDGDYTQTIRFTLEDDMLLCDETYTANADGSTVYTLSTVNHLERKRQ